MNPFTLDNTAEGLNLPSFEEEIFQYCLERVDPDMCFHNDIIGSSGERFISTLFKTAIFLLGLDKHLEVKHNPFSKNAYRSRSGIRKRFPDLKRVEFSTKHGVDIIVCLRKYDFRRKEWSSKPLSHIEVKTWLYEQFLNPKKFQTHVLDRFHKTSSDMNKAVFFIGKTQFGRYVKKLFGQHNIKLIRRNFLKQIVEHLINIMPNRIKRHITTNTQTILNMLTRQNNNQPANKPNNNMSKQKHVDNASKTILPSLFTHNITDNKQSPNKPIRILEGG